MSDTDRLSYLAALAEIGTQYRDVWGGTREILPETLRALLSALGCPAGTPHEIENSIAGLEAEAWRDLLPSVLVHHQGLAAVVPLVVADGSGAGGVRWTVVGEDGALRAGSTDLAALAVLGRHAQRAKRRCALPLPQDLPTGYHRLRVAVGDQEAETTLIVVPRRCYLPRPIDEESRAWGLTAQLNALRSARNWGIGDFTDLGDISEIAALRGAAALGVNPLHALFPAEPRHISPYSPSSRLFLNPLYIDVQAVPDFADCPAAQNLTGTPEFQGDLARARAAELIIHPAVAALKEPIFDALYHSFADRHLGDTRDEAKTARGAAFRHFQREGGFALAAYGTFNALQAHFLRQGGGFSWRDWPKSLHDATSVETRAFAAEQHARIELHQYLEWEADRQLAVAATRGRNSGLSVGLYRDLAVGVDPNGVDAWTDPSLLLTGTTVGAPPDLLNLKGQDWGFAPPSPAALRRLAYAPFIAAIRANMRHAGVLRLDHVMALRQLYCIPQGAPATSGAYLAYPLADLIGILALESERQGCAVVGEDLGTVPEGFRERLAEARVLSYRVLLFERDQDGDFLPPEAYPALSAATFATHDIATLKGYWLGRDLAWRRDLGLYPSDAAGRQDEQTRSEDRRRLIEALIRENVLRPEAAGQFLSTPAERVDITALGESIHRYLGRTRSCLALLQIEDAIGEEQQANLPGTTDEHPNWRRKLSLTIEDLLGNEHFLRLTAALDASRKESP